MGGWFSSENSEQKEVDSTGELNNNIIINADQPMMIALVLFMVIIRIFEVIYFLYNSHKRALKKKYRNNDQPQPMI
jgi:hypothetical protein